MEIFPITPECYPVAKVGGLADVVGALPKYQNNAGHLVRVVMPCYDTKFRKENEFVAYNRVVCGSWYFEEFGLNADDYKDLRWEDEPKEVFLNLKD